MLFWFLKCLDLENNENSAIRTIGPCSPSPLRVFYTTIHGSFQDVLVSRTSGPPIFDTPPLSSIRTHVARAISTQNRFPEAAGNCNLLILLGEMGPHFLRTEKMVSSRMDTEKGKDLRTTRSDYIQSTYLRFRDSGIPSTSE